MVADTLNLGADPRSPHTQLRRKVRWLTQIGGDNIKVVIDPNDPDTQVDMCRLQYYDIQTEQSDPPL